MTQLITVSEAITFGLVLTRLVAFFSAFPVINSNFVPLNVRLMLVIAMSFFIMKFANIELIEVKDFSVSWMFLLVIKELLIGFFLGVLTHIIIGIFSYASEVISYFMGLTLANLFDPTFGQISVIDRFFILLFYLMFFLSGVYIVFFAGLVKSFEIIPLFELKISDNAVLYVLEKALFLFVLALKMAFPFLLVLLMLNVALALINRLIPQVNVFIVGLPMQIFIGLLSLAIGAAALVMFSKGIMNHFVENYISAIKLFGK
ncbi:MAG TPA: flagellar biosynthetic protein FliR [Persephonella sp.]|nr:flagellar biosynthetic protein FliR [Hydrogenothermaceae bacterium]HIQ24374.1 flagellar biosynthetic protein FliR [Persephonella sp.]